MSPETPSVSDALVNAFLYLAVATRRALTGSQTAAMLLQPASLEAILDGSRFGFWIGLSNRVRRVFSVL